MYNIPVTIYGILEAIESVAEDIPIRKLYSHYPEYIGSSVQQVDFYLL